MYFKSTVLTQYASHTTNINNNKLSLVNSTDYVDNWPVQCNPYHSKGIHQLT